jgi:actin related protein 2/3 complex subunit 2
MAWAAKQSGASSAGSGLMHLPTQNSILLSSLTPRLGPSKLREPCELKVSDFDDVIYKLFVPPEAPNMITLHIGVRDWSNLRTNGGQASLDVNFPSCETKPDEGFDVAVVINADDPPKGPWGSTGEACAGRLADIKTLLIGSPFNAALQALDSGTSSSGTVTCVDMHKSTSRGGGKCYIIPKPDRVTFVFAVDFEDETDRALARIFLQEFVEAQRSVNNCPPAAYGRGHEPPTEVQGVEGIEEEGIAGFVSFTLFKSHVGGVGKREKAVGMLVNFGTYLQYHVKATKTYMHMRMRSKVNGLLQVLSRAKQESTEVKEKKTFQGKSFQRT